MAQVLDTIEIPTWANGPDGTGNGGWSAGLLAQHVPDGDDGVAVSLRVPPPLGRALDVVADDAGSGRLLVDRSAGDAVLVAHAESAAVPLGAPGSVRSISFDAAERASAGFPFRDHHPFPRCIACGTAREPGTPALHLWCGPVEGATVLADDGATVPVFADAWTPGGDLADPTDPELVAIAACWSALDCPSAAPMADPHAANPSVLARIAVRVDRRPRVGERCVLAAWRRSVDGRKQWSRSVLLDATGEVLGAADALWIEVRAT